MNGRAPNVTRLLKAWRAGDQEALGELAPQVYAELRKLAARWGTPLNLDETPDIAASSDDSDITAINAAMEAFGQFDPRKKKVVELRFFGGLSVEETATVLKISPQSIMRDGKLAPAWMPSELQI